jgi:hypothetical protein
VFITWNDTFMKSILKLKTIFNINKKCEIVGIRLFENDALSDVVVLAESLNLNFEEHKFVEISRWRSFF